MRLPHAKKFEFLDNLDRFSKYLRNFEKRSLLTKNLDFFARGERATLSHQFFCSSFSVALHGF